jgi:hypothetical protein
VNNGTVTISVSSHADGVGPCPLKVPAESPKALNGGVALPSGFTYGVGFLARPYLTTSGAALTDLSKKLVPIAAWNVSVCPYHRGFGNSDTLLNHAQGAQIERQANRFSTFPPGVVRPDCLNPPQVFVVMFVSASRVQVNLLDDGCGTVTNGVLFVKPTPTWLTELKLYSGVLPSRTMPRT